MIDVAVVDWGTPQLAARCVGSLTSDRFQSVELVDAKSRGWSYARSVNRSLARGTAPFVLALNADTRMLDVDSPDKILDLFAEDPSIAVVGPRQIDDRRRITHAGIVGTPQRPHHRFWLAPLDQVDSRCCEHALDCVSVSGAVYFARRLVWERLGGFLQTPLYYEETFFSLLAAHHGHRVVYTGQVTWEHLWNRSDEDPNVKAQHAARSRAIFDTACEQAGIARTG